MLDFRGNVFNFWVRNRVNSFGERDFWLRCCWVMIVDEVGELVLEVSGGEEVRDKLLIDNRIHLNFIKAAYYTNHSEFIRMLIPKCSIFGESIILFLKNCHLINGLSVQIRKWGGMSFKEIVLVKLTIDSIKQINVQIHHD